MFEHRLAALLGRSVTELNATLSQREKMRWAAYWDMEPWGPVRDNLHTAILAREIRMPHLKRGARVDLQQFMIESRDDRNRRGKAGLIAFLRLVGKKRSEVKGKGKKRRRRGRSR